MIITCPLQTTIATCNKTAYFKDNYQIWKLFWPQEGLRSKSSAKHFLWFRGMTILLETEGVWWSTLICALWQWPYTWCEGPAVVWDLGSPHWNHNRSIISQFLNMDLWKSISNSATNKKYFYVKGPEAGLSWQNGQFLC